MSEKLQKLWPDQYVNRRVQEHDKMINYLLDRVAKLEAAGAPKKPGRPRKQTIAPEAENKGLGK